MPALNALTREHAETATAPYPEVILQFGGGNFVRAFIDWVIDVYNEQKGTRLGILVATTTDRPAYRRWDEQEGLYHVLTKGIRNGEAVDEQRLITSVSRVISMEPDWDGFLQTAENPDTRYIVSNTTEAGIRFDAEDRADATPPNEFPAKLARWLHRRYRHFDGDAEKGCIVFPLELIVDNGTVLKENVLLNVRNWDLGKDFEQWIETANVFCNTLVDRIVPGVGADELSGARDRIGYQDEAITQGEPYHLLAIEAPDFVREELPLHTLGLNVVFTDDLTPYRTSKVRILNGAHTTLVPVGYLSGLETVRETVEDPEVGPFLRHVIFGEIIPGLDLPGVDLQQFADDILDRFRNPFIHHRLLSISLNSVSKFRERVLPSILAFQEARGSVPPGLVMALAALIRFYRGDLDGQEIPLTDDPKAIEFLQQQWAACDGTKEGFYTLAGKVLAWEDTWGRDLSEVPGLQQLLAVSLLSLDQTGMRAALAGCLPQQ